MTKYRIIQDANGFYAQERKTVFHFWRWLARNDADLTNYSKYGKPSSYCASLDIAKNVILKRIEYLQHLKKFPIIHKYEP